MIVGHAGDADGLGDGGLADVLVHGVVGDEDGGRGRDGRWRQGRDTFGVEILVEVGDAGQQSGAADGLVIAGDGFVSGGCAEGDVAELSAADGFFECDGRWCQWRPGLGYHRRTARANGNRESTEVSKNMTFTFQVSNQRLYWMCVSRI